MGKSLGFKKRCLCLGDRFDERFRLGEGGLLPGCSSSSNFATSPGSDSRNGRTSRCARGEAPLSVSYKTGASKAVEGTGLLGLVSASLESLHDSEEVEKATDGVIDTLASSSSLLNMIFASASVRGFRDAA